MKKLKFLLIEALELTKEQLKVITGATEDSGDGTPDEPTGDDDGIGGGSGYKCCLQNDPSKCSPCKAQATSSWTCKTGQSLTPC